MNKKAANILALLLSFIMIVSNPMSSLAQDAADQTSSASDVRVTAPGSGSAYDAATPEDVVGRSDMHAHGKGLVKPYVVVVPQSSDDITYVDPAEEPLVGSDEVPLAHSLDEFAVLYGQASNEAAAKWETDFSVKYQASYDDTLSEVFHNQLFPLAEENIFPHNGNPTEGDYARWTYAGAGYTASGSYTDIRLPVLTHPTHSLFHITLLLSITQQKPRKPRLQQNSIRSWNRSTLTQKPSTKKLRQSMTISPAMSYMIGITWKTIPINSNTQPMPPS